MCITLQKIGTGHCFGIKFNLITCFMRQFKGTILIAAYYQYLSQRDIALTCLPCKNDKFTTPLACLRHAVWVNQTGMGAQPTQPVP